MRALDASNARWRKSSRSTNTSNCVEVGFAGPAAGLRDSKNPTGPVLIISVGSLAGLVDSVR